MKKKTATGIKKNPAPDASWLRQKNLRVRKNMEELYLARQYADINEKSINKELIKRLYLLKKIADKNTVGTHQIIIGIPYDDDPRENEYPHTWIDETAGEIFKELAQQIVRKKIRYYQVIGCKTTIMYNSKTLIVTFAIKSVEQ